MWNKFDTICGSQGLEYWHISTAQWLNFQSCIELSLRGTLNQDFPVIIERCLPWRRHSFQISREITFWSYDVLRIFTASSKDRPKSLVTCSCCPVKLQQTDLSNFIAPTWSNLKHPWKFTMLLVVEALKKSSRHWGSSSQFYASKYKDYNLVKPCKTYESSHIPKITIFMGGFSAIPLHPGISRPCQLGARSESRENGALKKCPEP